MSSSDPVVVDEGIVEPGIEPGASAETMLVTTDSFEEYEQEMSSSIDDRQMKESTASTISEIQEDVHEAPTTPTSPLPLKQNNSVDDGELVRRITSRIQFALGFSNIFTHSSNDFFFITKYE